MVWNFIKNKFNTEPELTIDQLANYPTKQKFTIFKQEDEDERYERHMNPIRKAQEKTVSQVLQDNLEPINQDNDRAWSHPTEYDESDDIEALKQLTEGEK